MPEETDPPQPPPEAPSIFGDVPPDEVVARVEPWQLPELGDVAGLFPGYEVLGLLGRGAMAAVYQARQIELDRLVAIKLLPLEVSVDHDFADRFRREARALGRLHHPHIVRVFDFGTTREGHLFFVMEYIGGANLRDVIRQVALDAGQALAVTGQICAALAYAHGKGIVHRDIKPSNVLLDSEGQVKVADFGLARLSEVTAESLAMTVTGMVMGTPAYMAPEQMKGMDVDHRADIYALGVMLYEMLCRQLPEGIFAPPSQRTGCDARLDHIVHRAMQQEPDWRYQSADELLADVEAARTPLPMPQPAPQQAPPPAVPAPATKKLLYAGLAVAFFAVAAASLYFAQPWRKAVVPAAEAALTRVDEIAIPKPPPISPAPRTPAPAPPAPMPLSETGKWLAEQEPQWQAAYAKEVREPLEKALGDLRKQYLASLNLKLTEVTAAGNLDAAVAVRAELRLLDTGAAVPTVDKADTPAQLKTLHASYRQRLNTLDNDRLRNAIAILDRFDVILARKQLDLSDHQRLDEANEIEVKREQLTVAWLTPLIGRITRTPASATKERPFMNSLGMKFVPVAGTKVIFSVWETRVLDYEVFAKETKREWPKTQFQQGPTHPAVNVSWEDAVAFCAWLSKKEGCVYRLPKDAEWSVAVGLGEESGSTPAEKSGKAIGYPWGDAWPPPQGAGNYSLSLKVDGFADTAPAGSFAANVFGLHDMGGNVWEWCEVWYGARQTSRVVRGGSWIDFAELDLRSSCRFDGLPSFRYDYFGFRCVLVVSGG